MAASEPKAILDFETRSLCSLSDAGSWRYSIDPSTEVMCAAYRLPHWKPGRTGLWHPAYPALGIEEGDSFDDLSDFFEWVIAGRLIEAHNVFFEVGIYTNKLPFWPKVESRQWRCSAAKAASHSLPRGLEEAIDAMGITDITKDLEGEKVMKAMIKPRRPKKSDWRDWRRQHDPCPVCDGSGKYQDYKKDGTPKSKPSKCPVCDGAGHGVADVPAIPILWHETREQVLRLFQYCRQDVLAEERLSSELPDLNPFETEVFRTDLLINTRGFQVDLDAVDAALTLVDGEARDINAELRRITDGAIEKATQRSQILDWLEDNGLRLYNTRKETLDDILDSEEPLEGVTDLTYRVIELVRTLGRSSTAKYGKMRSWAGPDGRIRGGLLYHGANTGRWAGKGVQPHNFPKPSESEKLKKVPQEDIWAVLKTRDAEAIADRFGNVMETLSTGLRGAITAAPGNVLYVADYAGIEARVLNWLADNEEALEIFRTGADIYCYMADDIYGYKTNKHDHPKERGIGKIAVLGLGYQMGAAKFVETCALGGVTIIEDHYCDRCGKGTGQHRYAHHDFEYADGVDPNEITAVKIVEAYRTKFWRVKELWRDQEETALLAVAYEGDSFEAGKVQWHSEEGFLYCTLPNGRRLAYPAPEIHQTVTSWGATRDQVTFMGVNPLNHQWQRQNTYGGKLVENITQAVARDLMAEAMIRCEESGLYVPVLTVHDEVVAEAKKGTGSVKAFEALTAHTEPWAAGLPVAAEGWAGERYHK